MKPLSRLHRNVLWYALLALVLAAVCGYYRHEWDSFADFVNAVDYNPQFMQDFVGHYYPMSRQILQVAAPVKGYFYTSFFALMLVPVGALPLPAAMEVWVGVQLAFLAALCVLPALGMHGLRPPAMVAYVGLCATCYPVLDNLKWGQISIAVTVCVMAAFLVYGKGRKILAGVLLAFAAAVKFYPALFIVYFILKRDARACAAFAAAALAFYLLLPVAILGFSGWLGFEQAVIASINDADWLTRAVDVQYFVNVVRRWHLIFLGRNAGDVLIQATTIIGYGIALSCFAMAWLLQRREAYARHGLPLVAIFLSLPFLLKTSWPHYFVYLPFCQVAVFSYFAAAARTAGLPGAALLALPLASMAFSSMFLFNLFPNWNVYNSYGMLFLANLLLLAALYAAPAMQPRGRELGAPA